MDNKELHKKLEEIENLLRYYCLEIDNDAPNSLVKIYTEAIGQMGEAHALMSKLMDEIKANG